MNSEEIRQALTGPVPSISTPFKKDGNIDYNGLHNMVDFDIAAGSKTILLTAGDSHYICMSEKEIAEVTKVVVEHTAGRAMVIAADKHYNTKKAVEFAQYVRSIGADILMVMPPDWAHSCTPETLAEHYKVISKHIPVMIVTNVFIQRGIDFGLRTLELTLSKADGVVAIKDDFHGEFARKMGLLVHDKWAVISGGQKQNHLNIHPYGCDGYLSTYMRFKPEIAHKYWNAIEENDIEKAVQIIETYDIPFFDLIGLFTGKFDAGIHGALELFGIAERWRRQPYYTISDEDMEKLSDFFKQKKLWR